ncbi:MAG: thioesterase family protein [Nitrolancea sp.]
MAESETSFPFWHQERVRFRDVDLQHIVYYGKYLDYFDNALYEYLRSLGFETGSIDDRHGFDTSVVRAEIDYRAPARFDELLRVGVRVTRLGNSSLDAEYEVRNESGIVCEAKLILVNYDARSGKARPIPHAIRIGIERSNVESTSSSDST